MCTIILLHLLLKRYDQHVTKNDTTIIIIIQVCSTDTESRQKTPKTSLLVKKKKVFCLFVLQNEVTHVVPSYSDLSAAHTHSLHNTGDHNRSICTYTQPMARQSLSCLVSMKIAVSNTKHQIRSDTIRLRFHGDGNTHTIYNGLWPALALLRTAGRFRFELFSLRTSSQAWSHSKGSFPLHDQIMNFTADNCVLLLFHGLAFECSCFGVYLHNCAQK